MSIQKVMQIRRKFLEGSIPGAVGILISPVLLESCQDNESLNPQLLEIPPLLNTESAVAWNDDAQIVDTSVIEMIPEAGDILGGLVDILSPISREGVWGWLILQKNSRLLIFQLS